MKAKPQRLALWPVAYRWENLGEYYKRLYANNPKRADHNITVLDIVFQNPAYNAEERLRILSSTKANKVQRRFLADVFDIDWLVIHGDGYPGLVEEKSLSVTGKQFLTRKTVYLFHGTRT